MNTPSFHQETCQQEVVVTQSVNSIAPGGMSCVAAEVKEAWSLGCPQPDRPATGWEGPAGRVAWPVITQPLRASLLWARESVTSACPPARPTHGSLPPGSPGLEGEHRLLWTGKHGCCLSRDWGASLVGTCRPHILPPPSTFPKQPGLGWAWLPGVAGGWEPGTGQGEAGPWGQQDEVTR